MEIVEDIVGLQIGEYDQFAIQVYWTTGAMIWYYRADQDHAKPRAHLAQEFTLLDPTHVLLFSSNDGAFMVYKIAERTNIVDSVDGASFVCAFELLPTTPGARVSRFHPASGDSDSTLPVKMVYCGYSSLVPSPRRTFYADPASALVGLHWAQNNWTRTGRSTSVDCSSSSLSRPSYRKSRMAVYRADEESHQTNGVIGAADSFGSDSTCLHSESASLAPDARSFSPIATEHSLRSVCFSSTFTRMHRRVASAIWTYTGNT
ncbi:hypothetical protein BD309DRAFT_351321 [Dichomitus squalens]|nr:hypothetical protein BD309DRAFT_351321 [Dichomitus squalens]